MDHPAPAPEGSEGRHGKGGRAKDPLLTERRRTLAAFFRYQEQLTLSEIVRRLAAMDPPIKTDHGTLSRDLAAWRDEARRGLEADHFNAVEYVARALSQYEDIERRVIKRAYGTRDAGKYAALMKVRSDCIGERVKLVQDIGLVDRNLGTLLLAAKGGAKIDRVPSGLEMQRIFDAVVITEEELTSEAERAWQYGDAEGAVKRVHGSSAGAKGDPGVDK